jgi:predicted ATP-grasp superfamily ATP-dependent carboligase
MRVLVLDGNENQAVASVRSLSRAGHQVEVGAPCSWSKAGWSRACRRTFQYPDPCDDATAFVSRIAAEAARTPGTLVLPMTEHTTMPLSAGRELVFAAGGRLVLPPHATILRAFDKQQTTCLAKALGLDTPQTVTLSDDAQARTAAQAIRYPVVLKPRASVQMSSSGKFSATGRPLYARNPQEFLAAYNDVRRRCGEALAQEFIAGTGSGYFALMRDGELRAEFAHRRIRDVRPSGSGSSLRVSTLPDSRIREGALAILRALNWHGVAMVEFRVRSEGTPVFLEVNGRFWGSLALAVYAGVDFPALLAQMAEHGDVQPPPAYRTAVRCRWLLGDFRHLIEVWRGAPRGYPGKYPGRLRTLGSFLMPVPGTFHDHLELRDPLPELGDWLYFFLNKLPAALKRRSAAQGIQNAERRHSHP